MYKRPTLYMARQIQKSMMSEPVVIRKRSQTRDRRGKVSESFTDLATRCSTEPLSRKDARFADIETEGVRLVDPRTFFTIQAIDVINKDEFLWEDQRYVAIETSNFGEYSETIASRIEGQVVS